MSYKVAGIDVRKKVLMVVLLDASLPFVPSHIGSAA
jgi:hypothetical protein